MSDPKSTSEHVTRVTIRSRGWTDTMIRKLMPEPDKTAPNPYYKSAAPMKLYKLTRVLEIEESDEWKALAEAAARRRRNQNSAKALETRRRNVLEWARSVDIYYEFPTLRNLYREVKREWYSQDEPILNRHMVNKLRHEYTAYNETWPGPGLLLKNVKDEVHDIIQRRVNDEIISRFPSLVKFGKPFNSAFCETGK